MKSESWKVRSNNEKEQNIKRIGKVSIMRKNLKNLWEKSEKWGFGMEITSKTQLAVILSKLKVFGSIIKHEVCFEQRELYFV